MKSLLSKAQAPSRPFQRVPFIKKRPWRRLRLLTATFRRALHPGAERPTRSEWILIKILHSWSRWKRARAAARGMSFIVQGISLQMNTPQIIASPPHLPFLFFQLSGIRPVIPPPHSSFQRGPMSKALPAGCNKTKHLFRNSIAAALNESHEHSVTDASQTHHAAQKRAV